MKEFLKAATVKAMGRELYGYEISERSAEIVAAAAGALISSSRKVGESLNLDAIEPPFSYPGLLAEAARLCAAGIGVTP